MIKYIKNHLKSNSIRNYVRKNHAYHEAGHLVFSYLYNIPCEYVQVNYNFQNYFNLKPDEPKSDSYTKHIFPQNLRTILSKIQDGFKLNEIVNSLKMGKNEVLKTVTEYLIIKMAGFFTEEKYRFRYYNEQIEKEDFVKAAEQNAFDDKCYYDDLAHYMTTDILTKNALDDKIANAIYSHLEKPIVHKSIDTIAKKIQDNRRINRVEIEKIFKKCGLITQFNTTNAC